MAAIFWNLLASQACQAQSISTKKAARTLYLYKPLRGYRQIYLFIYSEMFHIRGKLVTRDMKQNRFLLCQTSGMNYGCCDVIYGLRNQHRGLFC